MVAVRMEVVTKAAAVVAIVVEAVTATTTTASQGSTVSHNDKIVHSPRSKAYRAEVEAIIRGNDGVYIPRHHPAKLDMVKVKCYVNELEAMR